MTTYLLPLSGAVVLRWSLQFRLGHEYFLVVVSDWCSPPPVIAKLALAWGLADAIDRLYIK